MSAPERSTATSENGEKETGRIEAFSDGVIAIAITLLALEVRVPSHEQVDAASGLLQALAHQWPSYVAFVISFLTILIMWMNHHQMFKLIRRVDQGVMMLNGLLLMGISLTPFISSLLADYIREGDSAGASALVFSSVFVLISLFWNVLWWYLLRQRSLFHAHVSPEVVGAITRANALGMALYTLAAMVALVHVALSVLMLFGLAVFYALPHGNRQAARTEAA